MNGVGQTAVGSLFCICLGKSRKTPIPVAERSKAKVCDRSIAGIASLNPVGSNKPARSIQRTHFDKVQGQWSVLCCQVSATDRSLVQRSPTDCGVSEYDQANLDLMRPRQTRTAELRKKTEENTKHI